jgi:hypothetical protein
VRPVCGSLWRPAALIRVAVSLRPCRRLCFVLVSSWVFCLVEPQLGHPQVGLHHFFGAKRPAVEWGPCGGAACVARVSLCRVVCGC